MFDKITVHTPSQILALMPHLLGFTPHNSIVVMPQTARLPHARVDFPPDVESVLALAQTLHHAYRHHSGTVLLAAFTDNTHHTQVASTVGAATLVLQIVELTLCETLTVAQTFAVAGEVWTETRTGTTGTVTTQDREYVAAQAVAAGMAMPAIDRAAHTDRFTRTEDTDETIDTIDAATLHHVAAEVGSETEAELLDSATAILEVARATGIMPNPTESARLLCAIERDEVREALLGEASTPHARG